MALSQKHRSTIYQRLEPILGEEEAEALLSQFPAQELDQPATKEFVRAEIAGVHTEIAALRAEMHQLVNRMFFSLMGAMVGLAGLVVAMARIS
jgi:hypothetical protein